MEEILHLRDGPALQGSLFPVLILFSHHVICPGRAIVRLNYQEGFFRVVHDESHYCARQFDGGQLQQNWKYLSQQIYEYFLSV